MTTSSSSARIDTALILVELQEVAPRNSIKIEDDFNKTYIKVPRSPTPPEYFSTLTNNVLNNPKFRDIIFNNHLVFTGVDRSPLNFETILTGTEETKQFFRAIGQLESLKSLQLMDLELPLSLLNNLLHQEDGSGSPPLPELKKIHLQNVIFLGGDADDATNCIEDFVSSLNGLPNLEYITTRSFVSNCFEDFSNRGVNKLVALEMVKLPLNGMVKIDIRPNSVIHTDMIAPETILEEGKVPNGSGRTWVYTDLIEVAIAAVQGNNRLQHLEYVSTTRDSDQILNEMSPTFAQALCSPCCGVLDTLFIGLRSRQRLPVLLEIANVLPQTSIRKFNYYGLPTRCLHNGDRPIQDEFSVERLSNNHCLEEMIFSFKRLPRSSSDRRRLLVTPPFSDMHQFYLDLNRFHRQCGTSQNQYNPTLASPQKWVKLFMALAAEDDLKLIYHYSSMAVAWLSSLVVATPTTHAATTATTETDDLVIKNENTINKLEESPPPPRKKAKEDRSTPTTTTITTTTPQRQPIE